MSPAKDPIWESIRREVEEDAQSEPLMASFLVAIVLNHDTLEDALSFRLSSMLADANLNPLSLREVMDEAFANDPGIGGATRADIAAVVDRDPACERYSMPLLYFKGFHALQSYRVAHWLWQQGRHPLALNLQSRISQIYGVDIHPAAQIGKGILIDHATSVVIGETAVVEDNVSILHEVTLGGTGKEIGDRHPKVREGVLIGAGAKILGNIEIGRGAKVGAGSVVLRPVKPHTTVFGVPARVFGRPSTEEPALEMDHAVAEKIVRKK